MSGIHSFKNDYAESACPEVLQALCREPLTQELGYGEDSASSRAAEIVLQAAGLTSGEVHFIAGGTLTNLVVAAAFLAPYESIIAPESGHICTHETGAIEATGHTVHHVTPRGGQKDGKVTAHQIEQLVALHDNEHMVRPRMVYLSQSTEFGTLYLRRELEEISQVCRKHGLLLYVDGARLGAALVSEKNDITLAEFAALVDVFYLGGTKNGALFGEALVIRAPALNLRMRYHLKQRGALLAKGRALGAQFEALLHDGLWLRLAHHANDMARRLAAGIAGAGYRFAYEPMTNQIFPILPQSVAERLAKRFGFYIWERLEHDSVVIRLVTSWATTSEAVDAFIDAVRKA
jgi:threonine aldolase